MKIELIVGALSLLIFFIAFYTYERKKETSLSSKEAMDDFFSGIFFLRNTTTSLIFGRIALFIGIPLAYVLTYITNNIGLEYVLSIISLWSIAFYFWIIYKNEDLLKKSRINFFTEFLFSKEKKGASVFFLWLTRFFFIFSIIFVIWKRV